MVPRALDSFMSMPRVSNALRARKPTSLSPRLWLLGEKQHRRWFAPTLFVSPL
jgi:hypothetical protein